MSNHLKSLIADLLCAAAIFLVAFAAGYYFGVTQTAHHVQKQLEAQHETGNQVEQHL